jgi:drug/metabolite transporter (DMT)-like permease
MDRSLVPAIAACLLAAFLFGASTPLAKALLADFGPWELAGWLYLGGALGVLPFALAGGRPRLGPHDLWRLAGAVILGGVAGPVLLLGALGSAPAGGVSLLLHLETVATAILGVMFFRESLGRSALVAMACIVGAGLLLTGPAGSVPVSSALLVALACACWGLDNHWTATIAGLTPARTTLVKGAIAGTINLVVAAWMGTPAAEVARGGTVVVAALALGALAYGASIVLYIRGAQALGACRAQLLFSTGPFFGVALATVVGHEPLSARLVVAGLGMAAGAGLLTLSRHEHEHDHEAMEHTHHHRHDDGHHDHTHPGLPAGLAHTHAHRHAPQRHAHPHVSDLHHRHDHERGAGPA